MLPLEFLIAVKINMPFKVTHVPSDPVHHRRGWDNERIKECPQKGDNKEREVEVALKACALHRMLAEEIGSFCFFTGGRFSFPLESCQHFICTSVVTFFIFYTVL